MSPSEADDDALAGAAWEVAPPVPPGRFATPAEVDGAGLPWSYVAVPGTWGGQFSGVDPDEADFWYRTEVDLTEVGWELHLGGLATIADVWVGDRHVLHSESMWRSHHLELGPLAGPTVITIRFAALAPLLAERRPRPRWRSKLVSHPNLRWYRTSSWGRMPSVPTVPAPVGPWRPIRLVPTDRPHVHATRLRARPEGAGGRVEVGARISGPFTAAVIVVHGIEQAATTDDDHVSGTVVLPAVERWWPHTHGSPVRYPVHLRIDGRDHPLGAVGFRTVEADRTGDGFALVVNGVPVFARGAVWTPPDPVGLTGAPDEDLQRLADAGFNLVRLPGTTVYEDEHFWDTCDELGLLVWSDAAFANLDYPDTPEFTAEVAAELTEVWGRAGGHPSFAVACGGSEVEQQAAMLGRPADDWIPAVQGRVLPGVVADLGLDVPYVTSSPTGGNRPFSPETGIAHYFGVGAYLRPLEDARRAGVRFASECLAVAVPPADPAVDRLGGPGPVLAGRVGVPRDAGAPWDFQDVRDHYVRRLFAVEPTEVAWTDPARALDLGRAAASEMMAATLGEWRRAAAPCAGAVILAWRDVTGGSGWGLVDHEGGPKAPWWVLRRLLAPVAVWLTDEGLSGLAVHVANDRPEPRAVTLRLRTWGPDATPRPEATADLEIAGHAAAVLDVESLVGAFGDVTWSYQFGPPSTDVVLAELDGAVGPGGRALALPLGAGRARLPDVGLSAVARPSGDGTWTLDVATVAFAQYVCLSITGFEPSDDWFHLEPGGTVRLQLLPTGTRPRPTGRVRALNSVVDCSVEIADGDG